MGKSYPLPLGINHRTIHRSTIVGHDGQLYRVVNLMPTSTTLSINPLIIEARVFIVYALIGWI